MPTLIRTMIQKYLKKLQLMRILTQRVGKYPGAHFYGDFKMYLFRLKHPGFFNKEIHILQKNSG